MRRILLLAVALLAAVVNAANFHLKFDEAAKKGGQVLGEKRFALSQKSPQPFGYSCRAKAIGLDPSTPENSRFFGVELHIRYADGTDKWWTPPKLLSPSEKDWQTIAGVFEPPRAVKEVTFYCRLASLGEADFKDVEITEFAVEPKRGPCRLSRGEAKMTLENDFLHLTVDLAEGGTGVSFKNKLDGLDYTSAESGYRLFQDKFRTGGNTVGRAYTPTVVKDSEDEIDLALTVTGPKGMQFVEVVKHLRLYRDSTALEVEYCYRNLPESMGDMVLEPWFKNSLLPRGVENQMHYLPTTEGVKGFPISLGDTYPTNVIGGWVAVGGDGASGMAIEFDYAHLAKPYLWLGGRDHSDAEWGFQPVLVRAGGKFATSLKFMPIAGLKRPDWCANGLAAEFADKDGRLVARIAADRSYSLVAEIKIDGAEKIAALRTSPGKLVEIDTGARRGEASRAELRLLDKSMVVFEAERSWRQGAKYLPKTAKAKPAAVKPFKLKVTDEVTTPCTVWAKPFAGGRIKALFVVDLRQQREIAELGERFDMDIRTIRIATHSDWNNWGMMDRYGTFSFADSNLSLKDELADKPDVIVISGALWNEVDTENKQRIRELVASGKAGLIAIGNLKIMPDGLTEDVNGTSYVKDWASQELLLFGADRMKAFTLGKARAVFCDYDGRAGLTPFVDYGVELPSWRYWDYSLGSLARAVVWSARRELKPDEKCQVRREVVRIGGNEVEHVFYVNGKGVVDWNAKVVRSVNHRKAPVLTLDQEFVRRGEKLRGKVTFPTNGDNGAEVRLVDGFGRVIAKVGNVMGDFELAIPEARTQQMRVEVWQGDNVATISQTVLVQKDPIERELPYMIGIESPFLGVKRYLTPIRMREIQAAGVNQIRFWRREPDKISREFADYGLDYDYPITDLRIGASVFPKEFGEPYARTKDKRYLCRKPCLHDEKFVSAKLATIREDINRYLRFSPVSFDCGDENTLTLWATPFDFCFGEHTLKAFREWLKTQYASLGELNDCWGTQFADWEDVMPDTTEEAKERAKKSGRRAYGAWADHRRFMELAFCGHIAKVKSEMEKLSPGMPLDMSGTQPPNGWTGMDMHLLSKTIGIAAAYDLEQQAEIIRSFGRPMMKPWYGYGGSGASIRYRIWNDAFRFLNYGVAFFSEENILMPDYSLPHEVKVMREAISDLQDGGARLLRSLKVDEEVLVHYSQASIHAAQIENDYVAFIAERDKVVKWLNASGIPYRFIAYGEIEDGELDRTPAKTLVLPRSRAISDKEIMAINRFSNRGGKVLGDELSGIMDEHCRLRTERKIDSVEKWKAGNVPTDGVRAFRWRSRMGLEGEYFGVVRSPDSKGETTRKLTLKKPCYTYDLCQHRLLGLKGELNVSIAPNEHAFYAVLPYEVKGIVAKIDNGKNEVSAGSEVVVRFELQSDGKVNSLHPVRFSVFEPEHAEKHPLYSKVVGTGDGKGVFRFRTALNDSAGNWRIVATDFVSGKSTSLEVRLESDWAHRAKTTKPVIR